jgi:hypothetical protein
MTSPTLSTPRHNVVVVLLLWLLWLPSTLSSSSTASVDVTKFLQTELTALAAAHNSINTFLRDRKIAVGDAPGSLRTSLPGSCATSNRLVVALSDESNNIECRVALERAPVGAKCIAPCGCTGSQRWVQVSVLNKMRRTDPAQWKVCQTCMQPFDYAGFVAHGGEVGNVVSLVLDHPAILRSAVAAVAAVLLWEGTVTRLFMRAMLSRSFWNMYPKWSRVVHLPLVIKFWFGKVLLQYVAEQYMVVEKWMAKALTDVESRILERRLPVTVTETTLSNM